MTNEEIKQNAPIEERIERMTKLIANARKRYDESFNEKLQIVKDKMEEKSKALSLISSDIYPLPSSDGGCRNYKFMYYKNTGEIRLEGECVPIEVCEIHHKNAFIAAMFTNWDKVCKMIDNDIDSKLQNLERSYKKDMDAISKGLMVMGANTDIEGDERHPSNSKNGKSADFDGMLEMIR